MNKIAHWMSELLLIGALGLVSTVVWSESDKEPVDYSWGVRIPMRDGVELNATIYRPKDTPTAVPIIVTITPYISDRYHPDAMYFARRGYAFVIVDTRGRGNSDGEFDPMRESDGTDGHDVVE